MALTRFIPRLVPAALLALTGCGQTGALYLPDAGVETPVEVRVPATPAPEPVPAAEPDDKEKKSDQPLGR
jgi:predicted small lipoprotein YifL